METTEILEEMRKALENAAYTSSNTKADLAEVMINVANKLLKLRKEIDYNNQLCMMEGA